MSFRDLAERENFKLLAPEAQQQVRDAYFRKHIAAKPGFTNLTSLQQQEVEEKFKIGTSQFLTQAAPQQPTTPPSHKQLMASAAPAGGPAFMGPLTSPPEVSQEMVEGMAKTAVAPMKGWGGLGVMAAQPLSPVKGIQRAAEAIESPKDFKPETKREFTGWVGGQIIGSLPIFKMAASFVGPSAAGTVAAGQKVSKSAAIASKAKQSAGLGVTLGGLAAVEEVAETGEADPFSVGLNAMIGAAIPVVAPPVIQGAFKATTWGAQRLRAGLRMIKFNVKDPQQAFIRTSSELIFEDVAAGGRMAKRLPKPVKVTPGTSTDGINIMGEDFFRQANKAARGDAQAQSNVYDFIADKVKRFTGQHTPEKIMEMMARRSGNAAEETVMSQYFVHQMTKAMSVPERRALTYMMEKGGRIPKERLKELPGGKVTPAMREWKRRAKAWFDKDHSQLEKVFDAVGYRQNYVPHVFDIPKQTMRAGSGFITRNPFTKGRKHVTLLDGQRAGLKIKTDDIAELVTIYDNYRIKTIANHKFVDALKAFKTIEADNKLQPILMQVGKAPANWPKISHPALARTVGYKAGDATLLAQQPVAVHPDIARALKVVLDRPWDAGWLRNLELVKGITKKLNMALSLFHHTALGESMAAAVGPTKAMKMNIDIMKAMKEGKLPIFKDMELTRDAVKHNLVLGRMPDFYLDHVQKAFIAAEKATANIPGVKHTIQGVSRLNALWDKGLWDYMHTGYKLYAYQELLTQNLKRIPGKTVEQVKRITAEQVNNLMGGQNWDLLMVHPKMRQALNLLFLAPDWNVSAMRQAMNAFAPGGAGEMGRLYWSRTAFYMFGFSNILNYANSKIATGTGRWMWENERGSKTRIFMYKDEDGRNVHSRQGKQFREPFEFLMNPVGFLARKSSPLVQAGIEQLTGRTVTGFPTKFAEKDFWDSLPERGAAIAKKATPFALSGSNVAMAFPKSMGASRYGIFNDFRKELEGKARPNVLKAIAEQARMNNIDPGPLYKQAAARARAAQRKKK